MPSNSDQRSAAQSSFPSAARDFGASPTTETAEVLPEGSTSHRMGAV